MIKGDTFQNKHYLALSSEKKEKFCFDIALFMYELHTLTNKIRNMHIPQLKGISGLYPINKIKMFLSKCDKLTLQEQNFVTWFCDRFTYTIPNNQNVFGHFDIQPKNIAFILKKMRFLVFMILEIVVFAIYPMILQNLQYNTIKKF